MNLIPNSYYVMSGQCLMDGPFASKSEAIDHLKTMCGEWASPELLAQFLVYFDGEMLDLVRNEEGSVINGHSIRHMS